MIAERGHHAAIIYTNMWATYKNTRMKAPELIQHKVFFWGRYIISVAAMPVVIIPINPVPTCRVDTTCNKGSLT